MARIISSVGTHADRYAFNWHPSYREKAVCLRWPVFRRRYGRSAEAFRRFPFWACNRDKFRRKRFMKSIFCKKIDNYFHLRASY